MPTVYGCSSDDDTSLSGDVGFISPRLSIVGTDAPEASRFSLMLMEPSGRTFIWDSTDDFDSSQGFLSGTYILKAQYGKEITEGYDAPWYYGETSVTVRNGNTSEANVECRRMNVGVKLDVSQSFLAAVQSYSVMIHSAGGNYMEMNPAKDAPLYLRAGACDMILAFTLNDGQSTSVITSRLATHAGEDVVYTLTVDGATLCINAANQTNRYELTDELFSTAPPIVEGEGFTPGNALDLCAGIGVDGEITMTALSATTLSHVVLTIPEEIARKSGIDVETDLLNLSPTQSDALRRAGCLVESAAAGHTRVSVNITGMLERMEEPTDSNGWLFSLLAVDCLGQVSEPLNLKVTVTLPEIQILESATGIAGASEVPVTVSLPSLKIAEKITAELSKNGKDWDSSRILDIISQRDNIYTLKIALPSDNYPALSLRLKYLGYTIATSEIKFQSPKYSIAADAFAQRAVIKLSPSAGVDLKALTSIVKIYANGHPVNVYSRNPEDGTVIVSGLSQQTDYTFSATVFSQPRAEDFSNSVKVRTESTPNIPNGDFEELVSEINYDGLPMGGIFTQDALPLYTRQNRMNIAVSVPKEPWCTVNAKTFCTESSHKNTWYMQPSTMESANIISGAISVRLVSVAFDPAGEEIEPYRQVSEPYLDYSPIVPRIRYRAAGKLFLGSYIYSPSGVETYNEGIPFSSRPAALNGVYRYTPGPDSPDDCGRVDISVLGYVNGTLQIIASSTGLLYPSGTNANFSVPLTYTHFGVPAAQLRVMVSSSRTVGSIATESAAISTTPNPITASSTGSALEIDNLTLSY